MTAPDYVTQAAELLREHHIVPDDIHCNCGWLIRQGADGGPSAGAHSAHQAVVLAAAGLIPTRTQWGVEGRGVIAHSEEIARYKAPDDRILTRAVTDWKDEDA